jgi:hypothetical protein
MIPEKVTPMEKEYVDVTVSSIIALMGGWLLKSFFTPELSGIQSRLDRIEDKIDKIIDK